MMLPLSRASGGALSARRCPHPSPVIVSNVKPPSFSSHRRPRLPSPDSIQRTRLRIAVADAGADPSRPLSRPAPTFSGDDQTVSVAEEGIPLEGVIRIEKPSSPSSFQWDSWGRVALLSGGDVLCLFSFAGIGRFSHGLPVLDVETLHTADPFIAGWFLAAYFLGGYSDDGKGINGSTKAILAAVRSWSVGIPLGLVIRGAMSGHIPSTTFVLITMGCTGVLLIGWRALISSLLSRQRSKNDVYRRGSPFELFELLTSLIRRW